MLSAAQASGNRPGILRFLCLWPEASGTGLWRGEEPEGGEARGAEGCGLHCLGQDVAAGRDCAEKSGRASTKIRRPIGFARWGLWRGVPGE